MHLTDIGLLACKPAITPMDNYLLLEVCFFIDVHVYRRLIGRFMYLTNTRPDITFSVQQLFQFLDKSTIVHYNATIRILKYIKGVISLGLFFSSNSSVHLKAFCDSDWGSTCSDSRQIQTNPTPVSYICWGQTQIGWICLYISQTSQSVFYINLYHA